MPKVNYDSIIALTANTVPSNEDKRKIDKLDAIIQHNADNVLERMQKGFILFQAQCDGEAIKAFNEVLERNPQYVDAYIWLAELLLFHWADAETAIPLLEKAQEISPQRADIYYLFASAYQKQNNTAQMLFHLQKAIQLEPTWLTPRMCLIQYLITEDKHEEARYELNELEKYQQNNLPAPNNEMLVYYEKFITGRLMTDYAKEWLEQLKHSLEN